MLVLSLNLWNTQGVVEARMAELRRLLIASRPDIVCLQEVAMVAGEPQISSVVEGLGYDCHYLPSGKWNGQIEGLAILSLHKSAVIAGVPLCPAPDEIGRSALYVRIELQECVVRVLTTHLAYKSENAEFRRRQIEDVTSILSDFNVGKHEPVIVCGDMNEQIEGAAIQTLLQWDKARLRDLRSTAAAFDSRPTLDYRNHYADVAPSDARNMDFMFADSLLVPKFVSPAFCESDGYEFISDHYGLIAQIDVGRPS